jgi:hypothetical protein
MTYSTPADEAPWKPLQFTALQLPLKLTSLSLYYPTGSAKKEVEQLSQLSALTNLGRLTLGNLPYIGVPGGLPSQLVKLSHLNVSYYDGCSTIGEQHVDSLTALQELSVDCRRLKVQDLLSLKHSSQLTSLTVRSAQLDVIPSSTDRWTCLTALQSLTISCSIMQPAAIEYLTQLRALSVDCYNITGAISAEALLPALSKLSLLTELYVCAHGAEVTDAAAAAAFTALTASTHLRSLGLRVPETFRGTEREDFPDVALFTPGLEYPHLRKIQVNGVTINGEQIQQLCSCCTAVESLGF